jgi:Xaa-Pro dipeptidase
MLRKQAGAVGEMPPCVYNGEGGLPMSEQRLTRLLDLMHTAHLDAVAINPGPTLTYLTGMNFHLMERPTVLLVTPGDRPALVLPVLEAIKAENCPLPLHTFSYDDNPANWAAAFDQAMQATGFER